MIIETHIGPQDTMASTGSISAKSGKSTLAMAGSKVVMPQYPILNGKYALMSRLGEGNTSKVYLAQTVDASKTMVAIKIIKDDFLSKDPAGAKKAVQSEVSTLHALRQHTNIIKLLDFGDNG